MKILTKKGKKRNFCQKNYSFAIVWHFLVKICKILPKSKIWRKKQKWQKQKQKTKKQNKKKVKNKKKVPRVVS